MKNLLKILILTLILVSCKKEIEKKPELAKSDFNLKEDYDDFLLKMTELDTLKIWMDLSVCTYQGTEKLIISKQNDSLTIQSLFSHSFGDGEFKKQKPIIISEKDTVWKFQEFLTRNKNRILFPEDSISPNFRYPRLQIKCDTTKIQFLTNGLGDLNVFIAEYSIVMRNLSPENENYIFGVEIPELYEEDEIMEPESPITK